LEDVNARYLTLETIGEPVDLGTVDVSFISLRKVLPAITKIVKSEGELVTLVKPQFEAGREQVQRGGVVKDPQIHETVLRELTEQMQTELNLFVLDATHSPIRGPAGNVEFLIHLTKADGRGKSLDWQAVALSAQRELTP